MYNVITFFFFERGPRRECWSKVYWKEKKRKGKYPLFIFRIRGLASNFNSIHFCPLNTILFQKLIFVKLNPSYRQKNRDSSTNRASLANNIKPVALTDCDFSNGASIIINLSVYMCVYVYVIVPVCACWDRYQDEKTGSGRAPVRLWVGVRSMSGPFV